MAQRKIETILNRFDAGIVNDKRTPLSNACRVCTNFDIITTPYKLLPYYDSEGGNDSQSSNKLQNFILANDNGGDIALFGLGVKASATTAEIQQKDLTTGAANDLDDAGWSTLTAAKAQSASGAANFNLWVYYKKTGLAYYAKAGTTIGTFDPSLSANIDASAHSLSYTNIAQGLVHSKDDILYIPYDNKIAVNNNGSWTDAGLTLPSHLYITSICEYGNYLAIACAPLSGIGNSVVYLWDRDITLSTVSESIVWGPGVIKIIDTVEGILIGLSLIGSSSVSHVQKITAKYYDNKPEADLLFELVADAGTTPALPIAKQHIDNRLYFMMYITLDGVLREGVWSIGRSSPNAPFALAHEHTPNNDTATTSGQLRNFFIAGDYVFQSYLDNGTETMSKTKSTFSRVYTSIYETVINPGMSIEDRQTEKTLAGIAVKTEPLPSNAQIVVKYKVDSDSSWTTILTHNVDNDVRKDVLQAFKTGRDFQFRIESTQGAVLTSLRAVYKASDGDQLAKL